MVNNATLGPVEVYDNSAMSINLALNEMAERIDQLKGLRGRTLLYDRTRIDSPSANEDAVDLQSLLTQESRFRQQLISSPGILVSAPGTSYAEISQYFRQDIDWSDLTTPQARLIVRGWGTESGTSKGVALHDGTNIIAEVTWDGNSETIRTGTFTAVTLDSDAQARLYAKGASASEDLILTSVILEVKISIEVVSS